MIKSAQNEKPTVISVNDLSQFGKSRVLKLQVRGSGASNTVDQKGSGLPQKEFDIMGQVEKNARLCTKM